MQAAQPGGRSPYGQPSGRWGVGLWSGVSGLGGCSCHGERDRTRKGGVRERTRHQPSIAGHRYVVVYAVRCIFRLTDALHIWSFCVLPPPGSLALHLLPPALRWPGLCLPSLASWAMNTRRLVAWRSLCITSCFSSASRSCHVFALVPILEPELLHPGLAGCQPQALSGWRVARFDHRVFIAPRSASGDNRPARDSRRCGSIAAIECGQPTGSERMSSSRETGTPRV